MELENLKNSINKINQLVSNITIKRNRLSFDLEVLGQKIIDNNKLLTTAKDKNKLAETSKEVVNKIIMSTRDEAISFIENIVNCALLDVFQNPNLKLKLQLNTEGAKTSISTFIEENGELYDIESGRGGGLRDLVSTAILICCRALVKPKIELPLLLDESFRFIHSTKDNTYKKNAFLFLKTIANKLNIQILFISGEEDKDALDAADNILFISKINGESKLIKYEHR